MINMDVFHGFLQAIHHLPEMAQPDALSDADRLGRAKAVMRAKTDRGLALDLEACVNCGYCSEACHFYQSTNDPKYSPSRKLDLLRRVHARETSAFAPLKRLFLPDITLDDLKEWQELVYDSCTECGRCSMICPMGVNTARGVNVMREALFEAGLAPLELTAVAQEQAGRGTVFGVGPNELRQTLDLLRAQGITIPLDEPQADLMMVTTVIDVLLYQDALAATARILNHLGVRWTLRSAGFEAANFGLLSGSESLQKAASQRLIDEALAIGAKTVILPECGHAYPALRWEARLANGQPLPFEVLAASEFVGREITAGRLRLRPPEDPSHKITYHDACKLARHGGVVDEPRAALKALGMDLRETTPTAEQNWCCGGGAGVFLINRAEGLRHQAWAIKREQIDATGADTVVVSCGSCRLNAMAGAEADAWPTKIESVVEMVARQLPV
ncbi:(Fe-S)-binding protein [Hydrogenophaga taeniospiralis]|uniref:(Fe-S)-binding protein n=1 Tax=Hydrogenophaga taeniospiralis TaxID=65656 RepID=UPI001CFA9A1B|nr:(Fe-S)-binding protein [Hydrogenophaga taeniospiralis]MCB4363287.1 (Fe-S)-binding protein [Hydrogenophaga taeniospiralis]